jgi:uncharacterized protein (DUF983 family)
MKKIWAIWSMKCPTCYEGDLYQDPNPFHFKNLHVMHTQCDHCGQPFNPEPGFYYGAMYASYGLAVGLFLFYFFLFELFYELSGVAFLALYTTTLLVLFPYIFRYSRVMYIHLFYGYDPEAKKKHGAEHQVPPSA